MTPLSAWCLMMLTYMEGIIDDNNTRERGMYVEQRLFHTILKITLISLKNDFEIWRENLIKIKTFLCSKHNYFSFSSPYIIFFARIFQQFSNWRFFRILQIHLAYFIL